MKSDRELDLVCIIDGKFVIGEAKINVDQIGRGDIEDLAQTAIELKADVAILAALSGDLAKMERKVNDLRKLIVGKDIVARGLISDWNDEPSSYL